MSEKKKPLMNKADGPVILICTLLLFAAPYVRSWWLSTGRYWPWETIKAFAIGVPLVIFGIWFIRRAMKDDRELKEKEAEAEKKAWEEKHKVK